MEVLPSAAHCAVAGDAPQVENVGDVVYDILAASPGITDDELVARAVAAGLSVEEALSGRDGWLRLGVFKRTRRNLLRIPRRFLL